MQVLSHSPPTKSARPPTQGASGNPTNLPAPPAPQHPVANSTPPINPPAASHPCVLCAESQHRSFNIPSLSWNPAMLPPSPTRRANGPV